MHFPRVALLVCAAASVAAQETVYTQLANDTNILIKLVNQVYQNLAVIPKDLKDPLKRQFSIFSAAVGMYLADRSRKFNENVYRIADQVKILNEKFASDVVASDYRRNLDLLITYIDQPINDVKKACPLGATDIYCDKKTQEYMKKNKRACRAYKYHINIFNAAKNLANLPESRVFINLLNYILRSSNVDTTLTVFLTSVDEHPKVYSALSAIYNAMKKARPPCKFL